MPGIFSYRGRLIQPRCLRTLKLQLTQYPVAFPQHCLLFANNFKVLGRNLLRSCQMCCIFRAPAAPVRSPKAEVKQLCREAKPLSLPGQSSSPNLCLSTDSKEAEDLTTEKTEPVWVRILPSVRLCHSPCPPRPVTFSRHSSGGKMEVYTRLLYGWKIIFSEGNRSQGLLRRWNSRADKCIQCVRVVMKLVLHCLENSKFPCKVCD